MAHKNILIRDKSISIKFLSDNINDTKIIGDLQGLSTKYNLRMNLLPNKIKISGKEEDIEKFTQVVKNVRNVIVNKLNINIENTRTINPRDVNGTGYFTPNEIKQIYQFPQSTRRAKIGVIQLGGGYNINDLNFYWKYLGINNPPSIINISIDGASNSPGKEEDKEVVLDIEVLGGINPNSDIYVYFAPNSIQNFYNAISKAVDDNVNVISISWGSPEPLWTNTDLTKFNNLFKKASDKGINVCCSSGDHGSSDGLTGNNVDFPASSPYVLACGGTRLICPNNIYESRTTSETVWNNAKGSGGGGFSKVFGTPSYQNSLNIQMRGVPDVCGLADPTTGWICYMNSNFVAMGGTSAVAPMWTAYLSLLNVNKFVNPILYNNVNGFHDIVTGNNGQYTASKGWDASSGLGSPNGSILNNVLR